MALLEFIFICTVAGVCFLLGVAIGKAHIKKPPEHECKIDAYVVNDDVFVCHCGRKILTFSEDIDELLGSEAVQVADYTESKRVT